MFLLVAHIVVTCASLALVAQSRQKFHIEYSHAQLADAVFSVALVGLVGTVFIVARCSFGYFAGFFLYTSVVSYVWLSHFTPLVYDHPAARLSITLSALAFLVPAALVTPPRMGWRHHLPLRTLDTVCLGILWLALITLCVCASYGIAFVGLDSMYESRKNLAYPAPIRYAVGIITTALLPFVAACAIQRRLWRQAAAALVLSIAFYPVVLTKVALFAPFWLVFIAALTTRLDCRTAVLSSLFLLALAGVTLYWLPSTLAALYFDTVNFRMLAIPGSAIDHYNAFFATRENTWFCHVSVLKPLLACPYDAQLGVVMQREYALGNFNASLFATEGIAAVGLKWAPLSALVCGIVIALGNVASRGLSHRFVLISSAMVVITLVDVPLTTTMVTHGAAALFLLWLATPRVGELSA